MKLLILSLLFFLFAFVSKAQVTDFIYVEEGLYYYVKVHQADTYYLHIYRDECSNPIGYDLFVDTLETKEDNLLNLELFFGNIQLHRFINTQGFTADDVYLFNTNFRYYVLDKGEKPEELLDKKSTLYHMLEICKLRDLSQFKLLTNPYEE